MNGSVRPSVCFSVRLSHLFTMYTSPHYHFMILWGITNGRSDAVSQVWIYRWFWNDAQGSKQHRRGSLMFFKVIQPIARSHGTKKSSILILMKRVQTVAQVSIHRCLCTKLNVVSERCPIVFQGHPPNFKFTMDKKSQILTRIECFRTVTPVWIHPWF